MGRFRQVTRTVEYTVATIMCVDITTKEVTSEDVTISGTFDDDNKLIREAKSVLPEHLTPVSVENVSVQEKTFCMPESMFIKSAMVLPIGKKTLTKKDYERYYSEELEGDDEPETETN